ncbi:TRAP-type C4-dicarboxylate transport system, periplasmic component [Olavius algarvensis associated proteobacterium Delta 3]|nr:TRAP-type C4-dicarboxylate transport system, periplasmic component [Olavius algarvensis associated proteobacterium Delta 3]CAB5128978.1 TRAP-type C4-dicarboxylate transport system, periplasmic component [Olavius algarvensis associated proteobacterium Delta 3]
MKKEKTKEIVKKKEDAKLGRRKFLKKAAVVGGAASVATLGFPMVSRAKTTVLKMQGSWGAKDIFNDYATDYVKRVNEMAGGRLKIQYLVSGAVVKAFRVQDAVHKGVLDAGHSVSVYWYGKSKVASLFGTGPVFGQNANQGLAWIYYGGGLELYNELLENLGLNIVGFFCMPMPTQPLGWFKKPIKSASDLKGLKYRTVGLAADLMQEMGTKVTQLPGGEIVPALERGVIEAFEFNNPTSDKSFGAQDVSKVYMLGSYHQAAEFFEIMINKDKFNALEKEHKAILRYAAEAASSDNYWRGQDQYSRDLQWLKEKAKVKVYRTPQSVMKAQLDAWDKILPGLEQDPFFAKVVKSLKVFSHRVAYYELMNACDYKLAYDHYFPGELGF